MQNIYIYIYIHIHELLHTCVFKIDKRDFSIYIYIHIYIYMLAPPCKELKAQKLQLSPPARFGVSGSGHHPKTLKP